MRYSGEDIAGMGSGPLDAVPVIDATLARFGIAIEPLEVVVEINRAGTEVATQQGSMSCEDGRDIDSALLAQWKRNTSEPFVKVGNNSFLLFVAYKL